MESFMNNKILYEKLFNACKNENIEAVKFLLKNGLDVNHKDKNGKTALFYACNNLNVIKLLIENGADKDIIKELFFYSYENNLEIFKYLIEEKKIDINIKNDSGKTVLFYACANDNLELVKYLVEHGADVNAKDKDGISVILNTLIESIGHPISLSTLKPKGENLEIVKCLVEHGAYIDDDILFVACHTGELELVKYLIEEKKLDINVKEKGGDTLLFRACGSGNLELVKYLVEEKKLDINAVNEYGQTALFDACEKGNIEIVKYLIKNGANINSKNKKGQTALFDCFYAGGNIELVKYLISKGIDINVKDSEGKNELWYAKNIKNKQIIDYLKSIGIKE